MPVTIILWGDQNPSRKLTPQEVDANFSALKAAIASGETAFYGVIDQATGIIKLAAIPQVDKDKLKDGILSADADGLKKMAEGYLQATTDGRKKLADGFFAATDDAAHTASLAKFADGFLSADTAGRAKMADKFITESKMDPDLLVKFTRLQFLPFTLDTWQTIETVIPVDDTIPQISEGDAIFNFNYKPSSIITRARIEVRVPFWLGSSYWATLAVFRDGEPDAIWATVKKGSSQMDDISVVFSLNAGAFFTENDGIQSIAFQVRMGTSDGSAPLRLNGDASGRLLGGAMHSIASVTEYAI